MSNGVSVEIKSGEHHITTNSDHRTFIESLLRDAGLTGQFVAMVGMQQKGRSHRQGRSGVRVKETGKPGTISLTFQPGSNDTCREVYLQVPQGETAASLVQKLQATVQAEAESGSTEYSGTEEEIHDKLAVKRRKMDELPSFTDEDRELAEREREIAARAETLAADRRQLDTDRARLNQTRIEVGRRRLQYEEDIGLLELALEDARQRKEEEVRAALYKLASEKGWSMADMIRVLKGGE